MTAPGSSGSLEGAGRSGAATAGPGEVRGGSRRSTLGETDVGAAVGGGVAFAAAGGAAALGGAATGARSTYDLTIVFQFSARWSAVRHASACAVSVGLCAPLVPITEAPRTPRFGVS